MSTSLLGSEIVRKYLIRALTGDAERRQHAPVSLAGPHTNGSAIPQQPPPLLPDTPTPRELTWEHHRRSVISAGEPLAGDEAGPYAYAELVRMNNRFRARLLQAFERGKESRQAAANRIATPRW
jgi:hypothetical protein